MTSEHAPLWLAGLTILLRDEHLVTCFAGHILRLLGARTYRETSRPEDFSGSPELFSVLRHPPAPVEGVVPDVVIAGPPSSGASAGAIPLVRAIAGRMDGVEWMAESELVLEAAAGWPAVNGDQSAGNSPLRLPGHQGYFIAAANVALLAVAAARASRRQGVKLDYVLDIRETLVMAFEEVSWAAYTGQNSNRHGVGFLQPVQVMRCADGLIFLSISEEHHWTDFVDIIGNPDWGKTDLFLTRQGRFDHWEALQPLLESHLRDLSRDLIADASVRMQIPNTPVLGLGEALALPQFQARGRVPAGLGDQMKLPWLALPAGTGPCRAPERYEAGAIPVGPLEGVRVLDLARVWVGPYCAQILAMLGASVTKVESRDVSDQWRRIGPFAGHHGDLDCSASFNQVNRGKTSLVLEPRRAEDLPLLDRMISAADVVVSNYRPGVLQSLGLAELMAKSGGRVNIAFSGYGADGPWARRSLFGNGALMVSGFAAATASEGGMPQTMGRPWADPVAGTLGALAVAAALFTRDETGAGWDIDLSLVEALFFNMTDLIVTYQREGNAPQLGNRHERFAPQGIYQAGGDDRWVAITIRSDAEWQALVDLAKLDPAWAAWPLASRRECAGEIDAALARWAAGMDRHSAARMLRAQGIPASAVLESDELARDPDLMATGFVHAVPHPRAGMRIGMGCPWTVNGLRTELGHAPMLGLDREREVVLLELAERERIRQTTAARHAE